MNRVSLQRLLRTTVSATMLWALLTGCTGSSPDDRQADAIYQQAENLRKKGQVVEALQALERLMDFKDTAVFKKAEASLLKEGISIASPLESWTLKEMLEAQNTLIRQGKDRHPDGEVIVPYGATDAWGRSLMVEYSKGAKFSFVVISAGKDKRFNTNDDLKIFNRPRPGSTGVAGTQDQDFDRFAQRGHTGTHPPPKAPSARAGRGERVVGLNELLSTN